MPRRVVRTVVTVAVLAGATGTAAANVTPPPPPIATVPSVTWETKGGVAAAERNGSVLYVGGSFEYVGPPNTQLGAIVATNTSEARLGLPRIVGADVRAVLYDGAGGWFIGGRFSSVGGVSCTNLAHIRADLTVDPAFCGSMGPPTGTQLGTAVNALARSGTRLYVGGSFGRIRFVDRSNLAALDLATGAVDPFDAGAITWAETIPNLGAGCQRECLPEVHALAFGSSLYVGGNFTAVNGVQRWGLAALDPASGAVRSGFDGKLSRFSAGHRTPPQDGDEFEYQVAVRALAISGSRLYAGGDFDHVNGGAQESAPRRGGVAALDTQTGAGVGAFDASITLALASGANIRAVAVLGGRVYVGGTFATVRGAGQTVQRRNLVAFESNGAISSWAPEPDAPVHALFASSQVVMVGGEFTTIGGVPRKHVAAIMPPNFAPGGVPYPFDASPYFRFGNATHLVRAVGQFGTSAYIGGTFDAIGGLPRSGLAAFDLATGRVTPWAPALARTNGAAPNIGALARAGNTLYVAGAFDAVNGTPRPRLAAVAVDTGAVLPWQPPDLVGASLPTGTRSILALAATPSAVYVGGDFRTTTAPFDATVALDPASGALLPWNAQLAGAYSGAGRDVRDIVVAGPTVYLAGNFATAAGQTRRGLVQVDAVTGAPTAFDANVTGGTGPRDLSLRTLSATSTRLYVAGQFTSVGGEARSGAAAVDGATGAVTAWVPTGGTLSSILSSGPDLLTATAASSGLVRAFEPDPPGAARAFSAATGGTVGELVLGPDLALVVLGGFTTIGGRDQAGLAVFPRAFPVSVGDSAAVVAKRDRWSAPVRCPRTAARRCTVDATLRERATRARSVIGHVRLTVRAGKARRAVFLLSARGLQLLQRRERVPVVVEVVATDERGTVTTAERAFVLSRPR